MIDDLTRLGFVVENARNDVLRERLRHTANEILEHGNLRFLVYSRTWWPSTACEKFAVYSSWCEACARDWMRSEHLVTHADRLLEVKQKFDLPVEDWLRDAAQGRF